jgi:hypothetical protein
MRDFLGPVNAAQVQTELGLIYVVPGGTKGAQVHAPHLTVDGVPLQASAYLTSDGEPSKFNLIQTWDVKDQRFYTGQNALSARLVDGRNADLVVLGKLAQVIVLAVRKLAEENRALFLEAERRSIHNELASLERGIEHNRAKLAEKERELAGVTGQLKGVR